MKNGVKVEMDEIELELVKLRYSNGRLAVSAFIIDEEDDEFGCEYGNVSVNLVFAPQSDENAFYLDTNNLGKSRVAAIEKLGSYTGNEAQSGYCAYPEFVFADGVFAEMRDYEEFCEHWR